MKILLDVVVIIAGCHNLRHERIILPHPVECYVHIVKMNVSREVPTGRVSPALHNPGSVLWTLL